MICVFNGRFCPTDRPFLLGGAAFPNQSTRVVCGRGQMVGVGYGRFCPAERPFCMFTWYP
ncbi:MAG: hypothetical protein OT477_02315 [Chloroflexi bacterium]|nr:hypothetical protein [Chloroflexota bacterium]